MFLSDLWAILALAELNCVRKSLHINNLRNTCVSRNLMDYLSRNESPFGCLI